MARSLMTKKERERFARKAAKKNAKLLGELTTKAPLFAAQIVAEVELTDADQEYWRWRRNKAIGGQSGVGSDAYQSLLLLEEHAKARLARELLGEQHFAVLAAYCYKVYPSPQYWMSFWQEVCTQGKRVVFSQHLEFDPARINQWNSDGRYLVEDGVFPPEGWTSPITKEEWERRFDARSAAKVPPPDDGGLADRLKEFVQHQQLLRESNESAQQ